MNFITKPQLQFNENDWQEKIRRRELERFATSLIDFAKSIQLTEDFTTKTPPKLANLITQISTILVTKITKVPANSLHEINVFLSNLAAHLRYVERAKVTQTPWSLIETAESFFKKQIGEKTNFIIRPTWSYNYAVIGDFWNYYQVVLSSWNWFPINELKDNLKKEKEEEKRFGEDESIYCISFPRLEKQNCLMHANWGHEVGHIIVNNWLENNFESIWRSVEIQIKQRIGDEVRKSPPPVDPIFKEIAINETTSSLTRTAMEASKQGLSELLCDIIGVHLFGLSSIAAILEFASRFELDVSPLQCDYYPPWRFRIRKMFEYCEQDLKENEKYPGEIVGPLIKWLNQAKRLIENKKDIDIINSAIETKEAYDFIEIHWKVTLQEIIKSLKVDFLKPYSLIERIKTIEILVKRLSFGIPPNEEANLSSKPSLFQDIIASAWVYKIDKISNDPNWGKKEDLDLLYRLVLKAIECSYVHSILGPKLDIHKK